MAFGMGFGELVMILVIVVTVFGSTKLPQIGELLRRRMNGLDRARPRLYLGRSDRWTLVDWLLLGTTIALATALTLSFAQGR
jgi:hypothetical protein